MATAQKSKKKPARNANRRNVWLLVITTLLIIGSVFLFTPPQERINQGLDIQGGLSVVLTAKEKNGQAVSNEDMEKSRAIIESRVNALGASEAVVQVQGTDQILVQLPGLTNTEDALDTIGKTGKLEFARLDSFTDEDVKTKIENGQYGGEGIVTDEFGNSFPSGTEEHLEVAEGTYTPLVTGSNITNVSIGKESETSADYAVNVKLDSEGAAAFAEATKELAPSKGKIVIILDNEVQSAPAVQSEIPNGEVSITGGYTLDGAKALQTVLESGSLPVSFEYAQSQTVGPTLGQDALASGVLVAAVGLAVVLLYLLVFYRGLGLVAAAMMAVFGVFYLGLLALLSRFGLFSLSLAGIAGIVLTIGMAADASILVLERVREEVRMGRSVRAASITGVRHGISTAIDADLVTLVSALTLFFLASASVKGFGLTLALGIACNVLAMLVFMMPLIRLLAPRAIAKHPGFWDVKDCQDLVAAEQAGRLPRKVKGRFIKRDINFVGHRRTFLIIAAVMIAAVAVVVGVRGLNFGIEFQGGTSINFRATGDVGIEEVRGAFSDGGERRGARVPRAHVEHLSRRGHRRGKPGGRTVRLVGRLVRGVHHRARLGCERRPVVPHRASGVLRADHRVHRHPLRVQDGRRGHRGFAPRHHHRRGRVRARRARGHAERRGRAAHHLGLLALRQGGRVPPHQREHEGRRGLVHVRDDGEPLGQPGVHPHAQHLAVLAHPRGGHARVRRRDAEGLRVRHGHRPGVRRLLHHLGGHSALHHLEAARAEIRQAREEVRAGGAALLPGVPSGRSAPQGVLRQRGRFRGGMRGRGGV